MARYRLPLTMVIELDDEETEQPVNPEALRMTIEQVLWYSTAREAIETGIDGAGPYSVKGVLLGVTGPAVDETL